MYRTLLVARREFLENVRTKGFWLSILLFPILIITTAVLPSFLARRATPTRSFVVADASGRYEPLIAAAISAENLRRQERSPTAPGSRLTRPGGTETREKNSTVTTRSRFRLLPLPADIQPDAEISEIEARLRPMLNAEGTNAIFAAVIIPRNFGAGTTNAVRYWCANQADSSLRDLIERTLRAELRRQEYTRQGLDPTVIARTEAMQVPIADLNPTKAAGTERVNLADQITQWAPSLFVYLLWVAIFAVSQMLLNSVIEEKSNRLIEVILSSVTPTQFMMGKLLGIAAVGMVMLGSWLSSLFLVALWQSSAAASQAAAGSGVSELPQALVGIFQGTWLLPAFIFYFICGYVLYAAVFLTIGSLCNTIKEAQNLMGPMMIVLMVPLFLMPFIPRDPNGPLASVLSWVPLYTPFVMMNRVSAHPPLWQVVGTTVVLLGFIVILLGACGRIFRLAILRTGQPPKLLELLRWVVGRQGA